MIKTPKLLPQLLLSLALIPSAATAADSTKPNVILMISDDHRWDCVGAAGNPNIHTPNMDRLAREGVYFKQATIINPQCMPSRAALLTGLASHANGRYSNQSARQDTLNPHGFDQYECLPEVLAGNGYHTAFAGKWHCPADPWNVGFREIGTWLPPGGGAYKGLALAHGKSRERTKYDGFTQQAFGKSAREMIRSHADSNSTQPLFLWLALTASHAPFKPNPEPARKPYIGKTVHDVLPPTYQGDLSTAREKWVDYVTAVTSVDIQLGKLMETLDDAGMSTNTVIVFLGDNGFMMGNRSLNGKAVPYEDSIRVPMMIWGPGVFDAEGETAAVASSLDIPPTLVKLTGAQPPVEWHGRDLTPILSDGKTHGITWSVTEAPDYENWKFPGISYRAVRTTDSKLIVWHESTGKAPEFYDLIADPEERYNIYEDSAVQPKITVLTRHLENWMTATGDNWQMRGEVVHSRTKPKKDKKRKKAKREKRHERRERR